MSLSLSLSLFRSPDGVRRRKLWPGFRKGDQGEQWLLRTGSRHHQLSNWNNHQQLHYGGIPQSLVGTLLLSSSQSEARLHWRRCKSEWQLRRSDQDKMICQVRTCSASGLLCASQLLYNTTSCVKPCQAIRVNLRHLQKDTELLVWSCSP